MEPGVKLQMRLKKEWLKTKCQEAKLPVEGAKLELAKKLAQYEEYQFSRAWEVISGKGK